MLITNGTRFSRSVQSSVFCDVATIKTLEIAWNHIWKKGEKAKKEEFSVKVSFAKKRRIGK